MTVWKRAIVPTLVAAALVAGCGSSSSSSSSSSASSSSSGTSSAAASGGGSAPSISAASFTNDFSSMAALKSLGTAGKGKVAAILPDTTSSTRYVEFDQPMIRKALIAAGVPASDIIIQNAQKSDSTFLTDAQTDITNGATVILSDPEDSGTGAQVEKYAAAHGVKVIDYDRLTLGGSRPYYVSFNNVTVGKVMGQGLVACTAAWKVKKPQVIVMRGDPTDNNATLFYQGYYNGVLQPLFSSGKWTDVANPAGTWDPPTAATEFEQAFTAHKNANAALIPNDENGAPIITYLKSHGVKPDTFPTTGQDATLTGLQNVLSGYQCGTVYKAIYKEAQAAVALAVYLRAGKTPPSSLLNGTTSDINEHKPVPSVLLQPQWVTPKNMNATVIKDNFVPASQLCSGSYAAACKKAGIS
ncbi:MAG TPA: substrate-binding domain-containing protein [Solirubrobacteraceae bacterium]|jgi:D-xylose transport system substrate-binding protein|nr:substrate-binding domain-containing protein [Solirubrobacteraceae bacterium]